MCDLNNKKTKKALENEYTRFTVGNNKRYFSQKTTKAERPPSCQRSIFEGILYVLDTGCQWRCIPEKYGAVSTIHENFMKWCRLGVMDKIMETIRNIYKKENKNNNWFAIDSTSKKAPFAAFGGKNPTDRAKRGSKQAILVDRRGAPLFVHITPANTHDSKLLSPILSQVEQSKEIKIIAADSAFDVKKLYLKCKEKNIALIASPNPRRKKDVHKFNVPYRWIIEQTFGILSWYKGLKACWAKTLQASLGFFNLLVL